MRGYGTKDPTPERSPGRGDESVRGLRLGGFGRERQDANLPPLTQNSELAQAASGMCQRMVTEHFFSHETPDGKNIVDRVEPTGYIPDSGDWVVGENLAWGSGALSTPQAILNGWMNSPGHKANLLAPDYKDIGLAACQGAPSTDLSGGTVYVNDFGAKSGQAPTGKRHQRQQHGGSRDRRWDEDSPQGTAQGEGESKTQGEEAPAPSPAPPAASPAQLGLGTIRNQPSKPHERGRHALQNDEQGQLVATGGHRRHGDLRDRGRRYCMGRLLPTVQLFRR